MKQYHDYLKYVLKHGTWVEHERTGKRILSHFGGQMEFDLSNGIPLLSSRKVPWKNSIRELLWFLSGSTNIKDLGVAAEPLWGLWAMRIQDMFAWQKKKDTRGNPIGVGSCGPIYGAMWRKWPAWDGSTIDQIQYVIDTLKTNPSSRRMIVTGWNPDVLPDESISPQANIMEGRQCLPPCHTLFQFNAQPLTLNERVAEYHKRANAGDADQFMNSQIRQADSIIAGKYPPKWKAILWKLLCQPFADPTDYDTWLTDNVKRQMSHVLNHIGIPKYRLNCKLYARSQDLPLGTVFNVFSYAVLATMVAQQVNMVPGRYIHTMGDAHIYEDQLDGVKELLSRDDSKPWPTMKIRPATSLFDYTLDNFDLEGYDPDPAIKFPLTK